MFSVPHELANLFLIEEKMMEIFRETSQSLKSSVLEEYIAQSEPRFKELEVPDSTKSDHGNFEKVLEKLVGNPVHVYALVERMVLLLPSIKKELNNQKIEKLVEDVELPEDGDLEGVTQAIARIQFAYQLDPVDMAYGRIRGVQTEARLSARQMMNIAQRRISGLHPMRPSVGKEYALAIEWAEGALNLMMQNENEKRLEDRITRFLNKARLDHNNNWNSPVGQRGNYPNEEFFVRRIESSPNITTGRELRFEEAEFLQRGSTNGHLKQGFNIHDFYTLCRGEKVDYSSAPQNPMCWLTTKNNPYFILSPIKTEVISEKPLVHLYHDVLTDNEMKLMTSRILNQMKAASVQDTSVADGAGSKISNERTQSSGWIWDQEEQTLHKLSKRTGMVVQLETALPDEEMAPGMPWRFVQAEAWQMGLYGPGGHYLPHFDAFEPNLLPPDVWGTDKLWVGSRIATIMFYLSDLVGGSTAFPKMGVAATPKKGSAVFWYNLHEDGTRDDLSLHGACPTALGIKWVSNKWIREGAQLWKRPCSLQPTSQFQ